MMSSTICCHVIVPCNRFQQIYQAVHGVAMIQFCIEPLQRQALLILSRDRRMASYGMEAETYGYNMLFVEQLWRTAIASKKV